uniref:cytochrome c oxidase subunit III n=1 Tax=Xyloredo nooi TaxID=2584333 RepID=UPI002028E4D5|nr:cytochrome c oxidase subunit III [Xyloredo nooi]UPX88997.1 cytochrome c oxidase subunit 3 [Xyloredo nooi]UPX89009.1 cytochrome c oxidase subunit 3 [Xyloredo nooi]
MGRTGYPLVENSIWPLLASVSTMCGIGGFIVFVHDGLVWPLCLGLVSLVMTLTCWWGDVVVEGSYLGRHTSLVLRNYYISMKLFILSEAFFFVSFFWSLVHVKVGELSSNFSWPPRGVEAINPWGIPFLNTGLLVGSAGTVTSAQKHVQAFSKSFILSEDYMLHKNRGVMWFLITISLGVIFMSVQYHEYHILNFTISDSAFGSCFFVMTGFHGIHVFVGIAFLSVACLRLWLGHFSKSMNRFNVIAAIWYWHFVDVVWILLVFLLYFGAF